MDRKRWWNACALGVCLVVASCSGGSGTGGDSLGGEDGGGDAPPVPDGATVGFLETPLTSDDSFVLHGTLPVPARTFPRVDGLAPFTILDFDGVPLPTQLEVVSRYPRPSDGADVVELLARVRRDPSLAPGTYARYEVVLDPHAPDATAGPGAPGALDLLQGPQLVRPSVAALLADPRSIEIVAYDCFGNRYDLAPLDGTGVMRRERYGVAQTELRSYGNLDPSPPVAGPSGTLPHLLGVHAYISTFADEEFLGLDLRFHNGHSGRDPSTEADGAVPGRIAPDPVICLFRVRRVT
jgi:hypothetical protein